MNIIKCPVDCGRVTQTFQEHRDYARTHPGIRYNGGIDYYSDIRNIYACDDGRVDYIGYQDSGYGYFIKIKHSWGFSLYAHLKTKPTLMLNEKVFRGQVIAEMGSSGFSTGTHVHFECRNLYNEVFDPTNLIEERIMIKSNLKVNDNFKVVCSFGVNFREEPANGRIIKTLPDNTKGIIKGEPVYKDGLKWWPVSVEIEGYIAEVDTLGNQLIMEE